MQDSKSTAAVLQALKDMGVQLALDDFGTGYSSLSHLKRFPIDTLKIDQSFVRDLTTDADDASIVSAVISMGKSLHMRVVAEGVETREQLAFLQEQNCPEGQGYYFSRPVVAEEFTQLLGAVALELRSRDGGQLVRLFLDLPVDLRGGVESARHQAPARHPFPGPPRLVLGDGARLLELDAAQVEVGRGRAWMPG